MFLFLSADILLISIFTPNNLEIQACVITTNKSVVGEGVTVTLYILCVYEVV